MQEPFFNDLRTQQQLGYVVFSRPITTRDVIGAQFLVQSPTRSCGYITQAVNNFLEAMRKEVEQMTEADLEVYKQAVAVKLAEKDITLGKRHSRLWAEIETHNYLFDRQEKEVELLSSVTLSEFKAHFEQTFFSKDSKRLDLHLNSSKHAQEHQELSDSKHPVTKQLHRINYIGSLSAFKKEQGFHGDTYKQRYHSFLVKK